MRRSFEMRSKIDFAGSSVKLSTADVRRDQSSVHHPLQSHASNVGRVSLREFLPSQTRA